MKDHKTIILSWKEVKRLISVKGAIRAVEEAFKKLGEDKVQMPAKIYIHLKKYSGDFRAMPAYIEGLKTCSVKWVNVHPANRNKGVPTVMAVIILSDPANGLPLCVMDGTYITALRTGAAGAVAAKYLARSDSKRVALVGCGAQARSQLASLKEVFTLKEVRVCGARYSEARLFVEKNRISSKTGMVACVDVKECVKDCDIIVTTTPSRKPIVRLEWLKRGVHINAIGADAPGKEELDPGILKHAKVIVDSWEQASHSGEINVPLKKGIISRSDIYGDIGDVVTGRKAREGEDEITVFDSTGLAVQDLALANVIYRKAVKLNMGKSVRLVG